MGGATETLAAFAASIRFDDLPAAVAERAKRLTVDLVGSIVRAGFDSESAPSFFATLATLGLDGPGAATLVGTEHSLAPPVAALANGFLGHSLDFDDTHADSSLHPSAPVVPAAFAAGELVGADGREVIAAIVAGYEVCCRIGNALDPTEHYARGFHPTATAGTFGAAAAAGRLYGLSPGQMAAAFGVAASQAAGSLQFLVNGAWNKRYQVGAAAMNGVIAATLARNGFKGSSEALEGRHGFLKGYSAAPRTEMATAGLGETWETLRIGVKPYPSCRYTHAALDGLLAIRAEHGLRADDFRRVEIGLHRNGITLTGEPIGEKRRPRSIVDGQFSMPFTAAVVIEQGAFGWDDYRRLGDPALWAIADRIEVRRDARLEGRAHPFGASLAIETPQGRIERLVPDPSGEPSLFPDDGAIAAKFASLARPALAGRADGLLAALMNLNQATDLTGALRAAGPVRPDQRRTGPLHGDAARAG
ncbi:MmgE/PrpD family protein [Faunimonas sp. B44]|uniref:MmgE/PrpD family protein n=1 Tax=Faunimonas sp. B44 TaxID=3461493 RepID=UPI0040450D7D